jgi:hypothetical protein
VLRTMTPLTPVAPESAVLNSRAPLLRPAELEPLLMVTLPPLAVLEAMPPRSTSSAPVPLLPVPAAT